MNFLSECLVTFLIQFIWNGTNLLLIGTKIHLFPSSTYILSLSSLGKSLLG